MSQRALNTSPEAIAKNLRRRYRYERVMEAFLVAATVFVMVPLVIIIYYVVVNGISAINLDFFTQELGSPARVQTGRPTGLYQTIIGTLVVDLLALLFVIPFGIGAGIMLAEYPDHKLNPTIRVITDTLNGMPAIVTGLLVFAIIVRPVGSYMGIAGSVALAIIMLPIVARATESVLNQIPWSIREAALALGLPRWRMVLSTTLPAARAGIVTGLMIAFARAAGEAAPLLFTSLGNNFAARSFRGYLFAPVDTLPQRLYDLARSPYREWHAMGWAAGIVLLTFVIATFVIARVATRQRT
jgi:phosphate transport system permease protein